jgi:hypothetical protein
MRGRGRAVTLASMACFAAAPAVAQTQEDATSGASTAGSSEDDGWPDVSGFLSEKYGFLPLAFPITEPAVGYGVSGGVAFKTK